MSRRVVLVAALFFSCLSHTAFGSLIQDTTFTGSLYASYDDLTGSPQSVAESFDHTYVQHREYLFPGDDGGSGIAIFDPEALVSLTVTGDDESNLYGYAEATYTRTGTSDSSQPILIPHPLGYLHVEGSVAEGDSLDINVNYQVTDTGSTSGPGGTSTATETITGGGFFTRDYALGGFPTGVFPMPGSFQTIIQFSLGLNIHHAYLGGRGDLGTSDAPTSYVFTTLSPGLLPSAVPEPSSMALMCIGGILLAGRSIRRKKQ